MKIRPKRSIKGIIYSSSLYFLYLTEPENLKKLISFSSMTFSKLISLETKVSWMRGIITAIWNIEMSV